MIGVGRLLATVGALLGLGAAGCGADCGSSGEGAADLTEITSSAGLADQQLRPHRDACTVGAVLLPDRKSLVVTDGTPVQLKFELDLDITDDDLGHKTPHGPTDPGESIGPGRAYVQLNDLRRGGRCYQTQYSDDPGASPAQSSVGTILVTRNDKAARGRIVGTFQGLQLFSCTDGAEIRVSGSFAGVIAR